MSKKSLLALDKPTNHPENGQSLNCSSHYSLSRDLPSILLRLKAACISIHGRWMVFYIDTRTGGQGGAGLGVTDWEEKYAFIISFRQMPLTTILIFQIMQPENRRRRYEPLSFLWTSSTLSRNMPPSSLIIKMGEINFMFSIWCSQNIIFGLFERDTLFRSS